jgi:uncharacterized protein YegP (UPF0339 family)
MAGSFVLEQSKNGKFRFNLRAGNHQIILSSELYEAKAAAQNGIAAVRRDAADASRFERKTAKDGSAYFVLKSRNGETIGKSEMYSSAAGMERGIASVAANAPLASLIDRT